MENTIGKEFMQKTKFGQLEESLQSQGVPLPQIEIPLGDHIRLIDMPDGRVVGLQPLDFVQLIEKRETLRHYAETPLSLFELAFLLWGTQGIKSVTDKGFPSAQSRQPARGTHLRPTCWSTRLRDCSRACTATWRFRTSWRSCQPRLISASSSLSPARTNSTC